MSDGFVSAVAVVLLGLAYLAPPVTTKEPTNSDPIAYLNHALDEMQSNALRQESVDWARVRAMALEKASGAGSTVDTYDAIRFALASLGDHHSSLHLTPALEALEARRKPKNELGSKPEASQGTFSPYVGRYEPEGHSSAFGGKTFAVVVVPKCFPENEGQFLQFETKLQGIVARLDQQQPSGWIVDLRGNVGGNMWPMLAGIGPVLGEGDNLGQFFSTSGHGFWRYRNGVAAESENGKLSPYPAVKGKPYVLAKSPAVAVLIDRSTGSSGEAIVIAFRGRPETRLFGEHTTGVSTTNQMFPLSDGAVLWLTIGVQADRTGKQYPDGIAPDEVIPAAKEMLPEDRDPVLQAAQRWLSGQRSK